MKFIFLLKKNICMAINLTYTTQCLHVKTTAVATICYTFYIYEDKGYIQILLNPMGCKNRWQIVLNFQ